MIDWNQQLCRIDSMIKIFNLLTILLVTKQTSVVIEDDTFNQMKMLYFMKVNFFSLFWEFPFEQFRFEKNIWFSKKQKSIYFWEGKIMIFMLCECSTSFNKSDLYLFTAYWRQFVLFQIKSFQRRVIVCKS